MLTCCHMATAVVDPEGTELELQELCAATAWGSLRTGTW